MRLLIPPKVFEIVGHFRRVNSHRQVAALHLDGTFDLRYVKPGAVGEKVPGARECISQCQLHYLLVQ